LSGKKASSGGTSKAALAGSTSEDYATPLLATERSSSPSLPPQIFETTSNPNEAPPPSFEEAVGAVQPGSALDDLPPDYLSVSISPNAPWIFPQDWNPAIAGPSLAEIERDSDFNVTSYSPELESNPDSIWRYFLTYSDAPRMEIRIEGYRYEDRWHAESYTENGRTRTRQVHRRERVTDFFTSIDASSYVNPQWSRVVAVGKGGEARNIRDVLEEFTHSKDRLKEIGMTKQVRTMALSAS
jgi:hypothetical protein